MKTKAEVIEILVKVVTNSTGMSDVERIADDILATSQHDAKDRNETVPKGGTAKEIKLEWQQHNRDNGMSWNEVAELVNQVIASQQVGGTDCNQLGMVGYKCDMCKKEQKAEGKQIYKHEWYTPPRSCLEGDYWNHGYYYFLCDCGRRIEAAPKDVGDTPLVNRKGHPGVCPLPKLSTLPNDAQEKTDYKIAYLNGVRDTYSGIRKYALDKINEQD